MSLQQDIKKAKTYLDILHRKVPEIESQILDLEERAKRCDMKMKVTEIADDLDCSRQHVYDLLKDGRLKSQSMRDVYEYKSNHKRSQ